MSRTSITEESFVRNRLKDYREWLRFGEAEDGSFWDDEYSSQFSDCVSRRQAAHLGLLSLHLWNYSRLYGVRAVASPSNGGSRAADLFAAALDTLLASVEITCIHLWSMPISERIRLGERFFSSGIQAVLGLSASIASGVDSVEERFWKCCLFLTSSDACLDREWRSRCFEPEFLRLYAKSRGNHSPLSRFSCVVGKRRYPRLLDAVGNSGEWEVVLQEASVYHMSNYQNSAKWDAEFSFAPYDVIPVELTAASILRQRLGFTDSPQIPRLVECAPKWTTLRSQSHQAASLIHSVDAVLDAKGLFREAFYQTL
jgi:hypothetical protein